MLNNRLERTLKESDVPQLKADLHIYLKAMRRNTPTSQNNRCSGRDLNLSVLFMRTKCSALCVKSVWFS